MDGCNREPCPSNIKLTTFELRRLALIFDDDLFIGIFGGRKLFDYKTRRQHQCAFSRGGRGLDQRRRYRNRVPAIVDSRYMWRHRWWTCRWRWCRRRRSRTWDYFFAEKPRKVDDRRKQHNDDDRSTRQSTRTQLLGLERVAYRDVTFNGQQHSYPYARWCEHVGDRQEYICFVDLKKRP